MLSVRAGGTAREFLRHGGVVFVSTLILNVASLAFHIACSRILGVSGYGAVYSMINVAAFVITIVGVVTVIVTKVIADFVRAEAAIGGIARRIILATSAAGAAFAVLIAITAEPLAAFLHIDVLAAFLLACLAGLQLALAGARGVVQGAQIFGALGISFIIEGLCRAAMGIAFLRAFGGVDVAMAAYAFATLLSFLYVLGVVYKAFGLSGGAPPFHYAALLRVSVGVIVSSMAVGVLSTTDVVLVRHYLSNEQSGIYGAIALVGKTLFFAVSFLPLVLLPKAGQAAARGTSKQLLISAGMMIGALSAAAIAVFGFFPGVILRIIAGAGYEAAARQVLPYGLAMAALGAANGFAAYRMGLNDFSYVPYAVVLCLCEVGAIAIVHRQINDVVFIVLAVSVAFLAAVLAGLPGAATRVPPPFEDVVLLQEELEAH